MDSIFDEGGPNDIRRVDRDRYEFRVSVPIDADGMRGSECPDAECAPRYFKVRPGTGITDGPRIVYCPYCRNAEAPEAFITEAQKEYAIDVLKAEAVRGIHRMLGNALGVGSAGTKTYAGGVLTLKLSLPRPRLTTPSAPREEELRREVTCTACGLEHAVFGFAIWCPDCGADVFPLHVAAEWEAVRSALSAVKERKAELGIRVATNDLENAVEDTVSIFEASLKVTVRRYLLAQGKSDCEVAEILEQRVRNGFQNIARAESIFRDLTGGDLLKDLRSAETARLRLVFEKRNPITHNRGVADEKFLSRSGFRGLGREVTATAAEAGEAISIAARVVESAYRGLFPDSIASPLNERSKGGGA